MPVTKILGIAVADDEAVQMVGKALADRQAELVVFESDRFPSSATVEFHHPVERTVLSSGSVSVALADVQAVWIRRIGVAPDREHRWDEARRRVIFDQSLATLVHSLATFPGLVVDPLSVMEAANKPVQLVEARRLGLRTPRTLLTNDPQAARDFCRGVGSDVIVKPLQALGIREEGERRAMFSSRLSPDDVEALDTLQDCPLMFQEEIAKSFEVRAVVVGGRVLAASVDSQAVPEGESDWRRAGGALDEHWSPHELPEEVQRSLVELVRGRGLHYGAADLAVDRDGEYVFFEVNPAGEWLWLEQLLAIGIPDAIADLLLGRADD